MSAVPVPSLSPMLERLRALFETRAVPPGPIASLQRVALERFLALGLPTTRDESWKYTTLRHLESRQLSLPEVLSAVDPDLSTRLLPVPGAQKIVFVNGSLAPALSAPTTVSGLRMRSLRTLIRESPDEAVQLLAGSEPATSARFSLLNQAFVDDGLVIDVDAGTVLDAPVYLVFHATPATRPWLISPRVVVRVGTNARLTLIEHHVSADRAECVANALTTATLADGATLEHYRLQQESGQVIHLGSLDATIGPNAGFVSHTLALGARLARLDLVARLDGEGASTDLQGVFLATGTQHLDTHTCIQHLKPHTRSNEDYRGLADGRGRGVFTGKVLVHPDAQKTDARQSSRNLLLSPTAEIDTRPELEIHANDVKCSHGATTGQLDPAALFYLRSRGISGDEARGLLSLAFVDAVLSRMSLPAVRDHFRGIFAQHLLKAPGSAA